MKLSATLNEDQCRKVAGVIRNLQPGKGFYEREYLAVNADNETKFRMNFFAVAICHHTYTLYHPGLNLWGWDFIEHVFVKMARQNDELLDPEKVSLLSVREIAKELKKRFSHDEITGACSLDRLEERAHLMKKASEYLVQHFNGKITECFRQSDSFLFREGQGLYEVLPQMEAFSDPRQKKSTFLIKLLMDSGLVEIKDPENFIPIMDYHMQRVLMRMGCVEISDPELKEKLTTRQPVDSDEPVRSLCIEAFKLIAEVSGHPVTRMNDYFWSLGRSCCNRTTLCHDHRCEKSPCTFQQIIQHESHDRCAFETVCKGFGDSNYRNLWQPVIQTHFY